MFLAPPLARFALGFGPPEYTSLLLCGLVVLGYMTGGSVVKNLAMIVLGLLFGMIGIDQMTRVFSVLVRAGGPGGRNRGRARRRGTLRHLRDPGDRGGPETARGLEAEAPRPPPVHGGTAGFRETDRARDRAGLFHRHHSGLGPHHLHLRLLCHGAKALQAPRAFRQGGHRGSGRARIRQQRRQRGGPGAHAGARRSHRADPGRPAWPR